LTRSLSFGGIGAFKGPSGRCAGGSGGLDMLNWPYNSKGEPPLVEESGNVSDTLVYAFK